MSAGNRPNWETNYRIPSDLDPKHYDLYLHPNLGKDTFKGKISVHLDLAKARDFIPIHINFLSVTDSKLLKESGEEVALSDAFHYAPNEFWVVKTASTLAPGSYKLNLEFEGRLDNGIVGFYKSVYVNEKGENRALASTKFQPTYARRAFPCFDEPSFKSTFTVTIVRPSEGGYIALSNMPEETSKPDTPEVGLTEVTFQKSVPMVSYLVIVIVCDFIYMESNTPKYNIPFRVYGTTQNKNRLKYALDIGRHITDYYQDYFKVPYPLPKLDMAAIPDYSSGATEHWGCITYRETALIFDEKESASSNQQRVADVIAHELTHQWFGNLMTTNWWNDLWLNEGFATYLMYKGVKSYETSWDTDSMFLTGTMHAVLDLDATLSSHPIVVNVDTPDEITSVFDMISYNKGSSVLRMLENFMGAEDFQKGMHNFLVKFTYKTAVTQDLFDELAKASSDKLDITKIMNTWTKQKGLPVINVTKEKGRYMLRQERFYANAATAAAKDEPSEFGYRWEIPITYITSANPTERALTWFPHDQETLEIPTSNDLKWLKLNVGQFGYYRVNYPAEDWINFGKVLQENPSAIPTADRTALLNDAFSLAAAGKLDYAIAFDLTKYLSKERELAPWQVASTALNYLSGVLFYTEGSTWLASYKQQLTAPLVQELGWEDTGDFTQRQLRITILRMACGAGNQERLDKAKEMFLAWKNEGKRIPPNLRQIVYNFGIRTIGDAKTWNWLLERYRQEQNAQEKLKLLEALTCIQDPAVLFQFLLHSKDKSIVRDQDFFTMLIFMSRNRAGEQVVWDFVRNDWMYLVGRFTLNDRYFGKMLADVTSKFSTAHRYREMESHFDTFPEAGAGENYRKIALETVKKNEDFLAAQCKPISAWIKQNL